MIKAAGRCNKCGAELQNGAKFCSLCGTKGTEDYGATMDSEYYAYFGELDYRGLARLSQEKS